MLKLLLIIASLLILISDAPAEPSIPKINELSQILIDSPRGWNAHFYPDGSIELNYGAGADDVANAPKGTILFSEVYRLLIPHLLAKSSGKNSYGVALLAKGEITIGALYIEDKVTIKSIMSIARDNTTPFDKERFNKILKKAPPVPEDGNAMP